MLVEDRSGRRHEIPHLAPARVIRRMGTGIVLLGGISHILYVIEFSFERFRSICSCMFLLLRVTVAVIGLSTRLAVKFPILPRSSGGVELT